MLCQFQHETGHGEGFDLSFGGCCGYHESDACGLVSVLLLRHAVQSVPDRGLSRARTTTVVALSQAQGEGERNTTVPRRQAVW